MLDYRGGSADVLDGNVVNEHVRWYAGTADDFKLFRVVLPASASTELPASPGPQIVLGIKGARAASPSGRGPVAHGHAADRPMLVGSGLATTNGETPVEEGSVLFVPAGQALRFAAGPDADAQVFVACCNDGFFA